MFICIGKAFAADRQVHSIKILLLHMEMCKSPMIKEFSLSAGRHEQGIGLSADGMEVGDALGPARLDGKAGADEVEVPPADVPDHPVEGAVRQAFSPGPILTPEVGGGEVQFVLHDDLVE